MAFANRLKTAENLPVLSTEAFQSSSPLTLALLPIFVGPNGLRAGWRLLMFLALFAVLVGGFVLVRAGGPQGFLEKYKNQSPITITPLVMGGSEAITLLFLCAAALIMGKLEHRKFSDYGFPPRKILGEGFLARVMFGFSGDQRHPTDDVPDARVPYYRPSSARESNCVFACRVGHRIPPRRNG